MVSIGKSRTEKRALHWKEIRSRVTSHEGELLTGERGRKYQDKWSRKMLGQDLSGRYKIDPSKVEHYERTKK